MSTVFLKDMRPQLLSRLPFSRNASLDIVRGLAILFMIFQHVLIMYGTPAAENTPWGICIMLAGTAPAAPIFMFIMGLLFVLTYKDSFALQLIRGVKLVVAGYFLNLARFLPVIYTASGMQGLPNSGYLPDDMRTLLLEVDILQVAGFSYMIMAVLARYLCRPVIIAGVIILITIVSPALWGRGTGTPIDYLLDPFWGQGSYVSFPLFSWVVYPLYGMMAGLVLIARGKGFTEVGKTIWPAFAVMIGGFLLAESNEAFHFGDYFRHGWGFTLLLVGFIPFWIGLACKIPNSVSESPIGRFLSFSSRHLTLIYLIQWTVIGWGTMVLGIKQLSIAPVTLLLVVITIVVYGLVAVILKVRPKGFEI